MLAYKGGQRVGKGAYWDVRNGHRIDIAREGVLPGGDTSTYLRMPSGVMLLFGPFIGLLYVIFLPFIGIALVATAAGRWVAEGLVGLVEKSLSFDWRPKNAFLTGKKRKKPKEKGDKK